MAWIETADGIAVPPPALRSGTVTISSAVDGARNGNGDFIGQIIGDDKFKIECSFQLLYPEEMMNLLKIFDPSRGGKIINTIRVFDPRRNAVVYMDIYEGDRSGRPYLVNPQTMRPSFWRDVKANLIQV